MRLLVLALALMLSGCASPASGLAAYVMQPNEVPLGCTLVDPNSELGQQPRDEFNFTQNPGFADVDAFGYKEPLPQTVYVAWYDCDGDELMAAALQFASPRQATQWADDPSCGDDDYVLQDGAVLAMGWGGGDINGTYLEQAGKRIQAQTRATDLCAV